MESSKFLLPVFVFFSIIGGMAVSNSWDGITYVYTGESDRRFPAAIGNAIDFTALKGDALFMASQKRIVEQARLISKGSSIGVELGHYLTRSHSGQKQFACEKYDKVVLKFVAVGVAESGESPVMEVESDCVIGKTASLIEPIWIPIDQLKKEKPANMELKLNEPKTLDFRFDHVGQNWPKTWALNSVSLLSSKTGEFLSINHKEIRELREQPIEMKW